MEKAKFVFFLAVAFDFYTPSQQTASANLPLISPLHVADLSASGALEILKRNKDLLTHSGYFVSAVCILHAVERLNWHIAKKKKFPDWLK